MEGSAGRQRATSQVSAYPWPIIFTPLWFVVIPHYFMFIASKICVYLLCLLFVMSEPQPDLGWGIEFFVYFYSFSSYRHKLCLFWRFCVYLGMVSVYSFFFSAQVSVYSLDVFVYFYRGVHVFVHSLRVCVYC